MENPSTCEKQERVRLLKRRRVGSAEWSIVGKVVDISYPEGVCRVRIVAFIETLDAYFVDSTGFGANRWTDIRSVESMQTVTFVSEPISPCVKCSKPVFQDLDLRFRIEWMNAMPSMSKVHVRSFLCRAFSASPKTADAITVAFRKPAQDIATRFCIWACRSCEESDNILVGAVMLEVFSEPSDAKRAVIHYIGSTAKGTGLQLVEYAKTYLAGDGILRLYSAADESSFGAIHAHYRWGFHFVRTSEWTRMTLPRYVDESIVAFMRLDVSPWSAESCIESKSEVDAFWQKLRVSNQSSREASMPQVVTPRALPAITSSTPVAALSSIRDATKEERDLFPGIIAEFRTYLSSQMAAGRMSRSTCQMYVRAIKDLVAFDMKAPAEMATHLYKEAVKKTYENKKGSGTHAAVLGYYAEWWNNRSDSPFVLNRSSCEPDMYEIIRKRRIQHEDGDGSVAARAAHNLPEGWRVHVTTATVPLCCSSPRGSLYFKTADIDARVNLVNPVDLVNLVNPDPVKLDNSVDLTNLDNPDNLGNLVNPVNLDNPVTLDNLTNSANPVNLVEAGLKHGDAVKVVGLVTDSGMRANGRKGIVLQFCVEEDRFKVVLDETINGTSVFMLKAANLLKLDPDNLSNHLVNSVNLDSPVMLDNLVNLTNPVNLVEADLKHGDAVQVFGLVTDSGMRANGCKGKVLQFCVEEDRFKVELDETINGTSVFMLKAANLLKLG